MYYKFCELNMATEEEANSAVHLIPFHNFSTTTKKPLIMFIGIVCRCTIEMRGDGLRKKLDFKELREHFL